MARKKNIAAGLDAVIYARYSSHNQREVSIEQQIAECTKHAAALGLRIVGTYEDRAISGKTDNRPRFQQRCFTPRKILTILPPGVLHCGT